MLLLALVGKMSASPSPYRFAYYRAAPVQQQQIAEDDVSDETEISQEDFSNTGIQDEIQDDDDEDSDEQDPPPAFHKLFPLPQRNAPGHNVPLSAMMGEVAVQGWNVPKAPQRQRQQQRARFELARDDDESNEDSDEDEEDEEEDEESQDDLPNWQKMFPNLSEESGPPQGVVDQSSQPEIPQAFRSAIQQGSRVVYVPASQLRRAVRPGQSGRRQYVAMRAPIARPQLMYQNTPYIRRQQYVQNRPQYVLAPASSSIYNRNMYSSSMMQRRPQSQVVYMPVRRNTMNPRPYVSRPYTPRYRFY